MYHVARPGTKPAGELTTLPELAGTLQSTIPGVIARSGRYAEALRAYQIAARLAPRDPDVQRGLASARRLLAEERSAPAPPLRRID